MSSSAGCAIGLTNVCWWAVGGDPATLADLDVQRRAAWLGGPLAVDDLAVGSVASALLAAAELTQARDGRRPGVRLDAEQVARAAVPVRAVRPGQSHASADPLDVDARNHGFALSSRADIVDRQARRDAAQFAAAWLPVWTGNDPERLASFYTHDTVYSDPEVPDGIHGRDALTAYLKRLLARFPGWTWTQTDSAPMRDGFVNYWQARVPNGELELTLTGVCLVELRDGLIARNQVFFDRSALLDAIGEQRTAARRVPHGNDNLY
jgi:SnoaL-like domain